MKNYNVPFIFMFALMALLASLGFTVIPHNEEIGKPYKGWQEGDLDINFIYTGRGESSFFIFPDGTSMLIDAGDWDPSIEEYPYMMPMFFDSSHRAGEQIADFIREVNPNYNRVDYLLISHFHSDHIGSGTKGAGMTQLRHPNYELSGVSQVAEYIHFGNIIDRAYPAYDYPRDLRSDKDNDNYADVVNYTNFIKWQERDKSVKIQKFHLGAQNQIYSRMNADKYKNFYILNLCSNGMVWNTKEKKIDTFYLNKEKNENLDKVYNENTLSTGIKLVYGDFSFFTGGDLNGLVYDKSGKTYDIEASVAKSCGTVDVCKVNHHGYIETMTSGFIKNIQANHYIACVWDYQHIQPEVISRMSQENNRGVYPKIFFTYFSEYFRNQYEKKPWINQIAASGHVIVKVFDNGAKYKIYVTDAKTRGMIVKSVYGPFSTRL